MSYTNQTTHYGIPLPTQTDLVNGLDWNDSSERIDTAVYEASQAAQTASTDITAIKGDIVNLQGADTQFAEDLLVATGRITTLEQNAGIDEDSIQDAFDMITDTEVSQAQSDVHVNVNQWFRYNGVLYVCTQEINIGDTIIPNVNCRATNIEDEMPSGGGEVIDVTARAEIGDLTQLQTTAKNNLVAAINEVASSGGSAVKNSKSGTVNINLTTSASVSLGFTPDPTKTIVVHSDIISNGSSGFVYVTYTISGSTLTFNTNAAGMGDVQYNVVEFN